MDEAGKHTPGQGTWGNCGPGCPFKDDAWKTDDTLKVTHHSADQKETWTAVKLCVIMSYSLLLIALMVKVLGISLYMVLKYLGELITNHYSCSAMMISNTLKRLEDENEMKIALKLLGIMASSLLLLGLMITCLGMHWFLKLS